MASRNRRGTSTTALGVATLSSALLLLAGCGGSGSTPGVAHLRADSAKSGSPETGSGESSAPKSRAEAQQKLVAYAQCMRAHGVPDFPEPVEGGIQLHAGPGSGLDPGSAQFQAAERQCHKFTACMRSHGVANFPEPEFQGNGVRLKLKAGSGLDPRSPQFQAAQKACRQYFGPPGSKGAPPAGAAPSGAGGEQSGSVAATP